MDYRQILYRTDGHVAEVTLNRPDRLNAYTRRMAEELLDAFDRIDADPDVRAVILTGAGRAFCAGYDLEDASAFSTGPDPEAAARDPEAAREPGARLTLRIFRCLKPVIGVVNGPAVGIGATMLLPMDYRFAATPARFGFVFTQRGITPEACSTWFLPRLVGVAQALDWTLTGRVFGAEEALAGGLVSRVEDADAILEHARSVARRLSETAAPVSVSASRQMMWQGLTIADPMEASRMETIMLAHRGRSADAHEGVAAFLEKRAPAFPDRVPEALPPIYPWRA